MRRGTDGEEQASPGCATAMGAATFLTLVAVVMGDWYARVDGYFWVCLSVWVAAGVMVLGGLYAAVVETYGPEQPRVRFRPGPVSRHRGDGAPVPEPVREPWGADVEPPAAGQRPGQPSDPQITIALAEGEDGRPDHALMCPYCRYPLNEGEARVLCPACGEPHHRECWRANGGCTTYGCREKA
jgi:hypothetical protein